MTPARRVHWSSEIDVGIVTPRRRGCQLIYWLLDDSLRLLPASAPLQLIATTGDL